MLQLVFLVRFGQNTCCITALNLARPARQNRLERDASGQNLGISHPSTCLATFGNLAVQNWKESSSRRPWVRRRPWFTTYHSASKKSTALFEVLYSPTKCWNTITLPGSGYTFVYFFGFLVKSRMGRSVKTSGRLIFTTCCRNRTAGGPTNWFWRLSCRFYKLSVGAYTKSEWVPERFSQHSLAVQQSNSFNSLTSSPYGLYPVSYSIEHSTNICLWATAFANLALKFGFCTSKSIPGAISEVSWLDSGQKKVRNFNFGSQSTRVFE